MSGSGIGSNSSDPNLNVAS